MLTACWRCWPVRGPAIHAGPAWRSRRCAGKSSLQHPLFGGAVHRWRWRDGIVAAMGLPRKCPSRMRTICLPRAAPVVSGGVPARYS